ncbi:MAG: hypothetical protein HOU01_24435 [Streptomycetaceae bacterium]|jgi:hypothetical protein|nr:hypothetical protein [Streptomycetaceae bacterium]
MSGGSPQMRAQGLRGAVGLLVFLALLIGAALFGGCALIGKQNRASDAGASPSASTLPPIVSVPPAQPIPRGAGTPTEPLPSLDAQASADATAVSQAALTVLFSYDTMTDTTAQDAAVRAQQWMTDRYAATQREHVVVAPPGADWTLWTGHKVYTKPTLTQSHEPAPPDSDVLAYRQWIVRYTPTGRDGWKGTESLVVVFVTLTRATPAEPWRIADLGVRA